MKRFVAPTIQEAMIRVKLDMGKDAVIIHTRKFKEGGFLGFFAKEMVEVTAALEDKISQATINHALNSQANNNMNNQGTNHDNSSKHTYNADSIPVAATSTNAKSFEWSREADKLEIQKEFAEMRSLMEKVSDQIEQKDRVETYPPVLQKYYQNMVNNDIDDMLAKSLIQAIFTNLTKEELGEEEKINAALHKNLEKLLKKPKPIVFPPIDSVNQTVALVGPTGVGKTTTIAKLAATFSIVDKRKVALITADTYRIAAVEQLKTFGDIIGVPVEVAYTPQELKEAVQLHADKDLILIDSAGRSHKNALQMSDLKGFLEAAKPSDIFLVLSSTTKSNDMLEIIDSYNDVAVSRLIFTKLDETSSYGAILNVVNKSKKPLSYVTVGQSVPDDIEVANSSRLADLLIRGQLS
ncbi:MAG: flagellar biosynthesis protein FlhF [Carboxydocellales bacterium]